MAEITTTKKLNLSQLGHETGKPMHFIQDSRQTVITFDGRQISEADMQAAIDAHVADDTWRPPPSEQDRQREADTQTLDAFVSNANPTAAQTAAALKAFIRSRR